LSSCTYREVGRIRITYLRTRNRDAVGAPREKKLTNVPGVNVGQTDCANKSGNVTFT